MRLSSTKDLEMKRDMNLLLKSIIVSLGLFIIFVEQSFAQIASPGVVITELNGQQVYEGDGGYDQIDYEGRSTDFTFVRNADRSVSVTKPDGVTDRLINIDGFWFAGEQQWYAIEDLEVPADAGQTITGSPDRYDQVDYPGFAADYQFVRNSDNTVSVRKPAGGVDLLTDIDGFWFLDEGRWYPINQLVEALSGDRTITGGPEYDQVDYPGAAAEYNFTRNEDGSVSVSKPDGSTDTLIDIDGFWFQGEERWYDLESLLQPENRIIVGTADYDQVDYDGDRADYTFVQNSDGTVTVFRPGGVTDTLTSIDGFWFRGEETWYSIEDIFDEGTGTLVNGVITGSNDVNDNLIGDDQNNVFFAGRGTDLVRGFGGQDSLRADGDVFEWTYRTEPNDTVVMTHPTWGENTLISIESVFSLRSGQAFSMSEAIASTDGLPAFRLDNDNVINGTNGDDDIPGQVGVQGFYGGLGDDIYRGTNDFEQVNYDGARAEFTFTQNGDGSIGVSHPIWGNDTLINIDALIFTGVEPGVGGTRTADFEFVNINDLFN